MPAIDNALISMILNATLPTGTSAVPGTWTALSNSAMKLKLTSSASSAGSSGTELTGTGYVTGGTAMTGASAASSGGTSVTLPNQTGGIPWTAGSGSSWSIVSLEITGGTGARAWYGTFTGQPISVAVGNTFNVAQSAVSVALS